MGNLKTEKKYFLMIPLEGKKIPPKKIIQNINHFQVSEEICINYVWIFIFYFSISFPFQQPTEKMIFKIMRNKKKFLANQDYLFNISNFMQKVTTNKIKNDGTKIDFRIVELYP
jgi:hypothetical protein